MNEDLKWLAENVHEWNFDDESRLVKSKHDGEYFFLRFNSDRGYTREQWQAARDELEQRPENHSVEPTEKVWRGPENGLPPAGVEFEFSTNGRSWEDRVMLFNDGITCLMAHKKYPANRWHYKCDDPDILYRPLRTEEDKAVEEMVSYIYGLPVEDKRKAEHAARVLYSAGYRKQEAE